MKILILMLKGVAVGGANVIPGVSGATLAVIFRIYDKLIESINDLFTDMKKSLKFLIPVVIGMAVGVLAVGKAIGFLLENYSMQAAGFIAGLMAGSLPFIYNQAVFEIKDKPKMKYYITAVIAAIFIISLFIIQTEYFPESAVEEAEALSFNIWLALRLFIGGVFAAATMIIPGISGAMVLMLFGLYPITIHAISLISDFLVSFDFNLLWEIIFIAAPLGIGIVAGILLGSKIIAMLFKKFHSATYFAILGFVFGTVFIIFKNEDTYQSHDVINAWVLLFTSITFICGTLLSLKLGKQKES